MKLPRRSGLLLLGFLSCGNEQVSLPCEITRRACQEAIFRAVVETREQTNATVPGVRVITRAQLADELRTSVEQEAAQRSLADTELANPTQRGLSLLGLMPEPDMQSADDAYIAQSVASIAAYYSHSSHDVTVIADQAADLDDATITLAHEFVHALQDQREGLSRLSQKYVHASDDDDAFTSLVEGEATWLSYVAYYREARQVEYRALHHESAFKSILDKTLATIRKSGAPLLEATELLPYPIGGEHVARVHIDRGLSAVAALFDDPPLTLRAYVDDDYRDRLPVMLDCDEPEPPSGYVRIDSDRLGFAGLLSLALAHDQGEQEAFALARAWRGDRISLYALAKPPASGADEPVAVSWRLQLDSVSSAQALLNILLAERGPLDVVPQGSAVVISAVSDPALLATWHPGESCPLQAKGRTPGGGGSLSALLRRRLGITR
jgi:hypothetical protein